MIKWIGMWAMVLLFLCFILMTTTVFSDLNSSASTHDAMVQAIATDVAKEGPVQDEVFLVPIPPETEPTLSIAH